MIEVRNVSLSMRLGDLLLWPIMFLLGGVKRDSIQETHFWHSQPIDPKEIDSALSVSLAGDDPSTVLTNKVFPFPAFHAPIFGGWRNYSVLQVQFADPKWHVGWIHRAFTPGSRPRAHVHRLGIAEREVKVLTQPHGFVTEYFAIGSSGEQLPLKCIDRGVLGDLKYPQIKLL